MILLLIFVLIAIVTSLMITNILVNLMPKLGVVDVPCDRRVHKKSTPRAGGLGLVILMLFVMPFCEYFIHGKILYSFTILKYFIPVAAISFWDDVSPVPILIRLFVHIFCSIFIITAMIHPATVLHYEISVYFDLAISTLALIAFLNVYNFLDGIDGITVSQTMHLSATLIALCILNYEIIHKPEIIITICSLIFGWAVGFAYFNWPPAKIFMGDVGSISIGFLLGMCMLMMASSSAKLFAACVIASLYYIADGGLTILIRLMKGEKIWEPHLQHFFQKAAAQGMSHKRVVKRIIKCNLGLMAFAIASTYYPVISIIFAFMLVIITLVRSVI